MASKFNDVWTQKARALGFPSRAVFKLLEANKKYNFIKPGAQVIDLGCAPGSWSKLASKLSGRKGFVLGMDLTLLSHNEQRDMGVDVNDINKPVLNKFVNSAVRRGRELEVDDDDDDSDIIDSNGLLKTERRLIRSRSPVKFINGDVTEWNPPKDLRHSFDVVLSDMAPKTTGSPQHDSAISCELCHSVLDLCAQVMKPPTTKSVTISNEEWEKIKLDHERKAVSSNNSSDMQEISEALREMMAEEVKEMTIREDLDPNVIHMHLVKKAIRKSALRKDKVGALKSKNKTTLEETPTTIEKHTYISPVRIDRSALIQIRNGKEYTTYYNGTLYMKVFQGDKFMELYRRVKNMFNIVHTFKPVSSRSESVEIFIFARGYRGPFTYAELNDNTVHLPGRQNIKEMQGRKIEDVSSYGEDVAPELTQDEIVEEMKKKHFAQIPEFERQMMLRNQSSVNTTIPEELHDKFGIGERKVKYSKDMSIDDIYSSMGVEYEFTNDSAALNNKTRWAYEEAVSKANVMTNIHDALAGNALHDEKLYGHTIHHLSPEAAQIKTQNEFLGFKPVNAFDTEEMIDRLNTKLHTGKGTATELDDDHVLVHAGKGDTKIVAMGLNTPSAKSLFGTIALDHVPSPEELSSAMNMYWEEGMNFADHVQKEYGYKEIGGFEDYDEFEEFDVEESDGDLVYEKFEGEVSSARDNVEMTNIMMEESKNTGPSVLEELDDEEMFEESD